MQSPFLTDHSAKCARNLKLKYALFWDIVWQRIVAYYAA